MPYLFVGMVKTVEEGILWDCCSICRTVLVTLLRSRELTELIWLESCLQEGSGIVDLISVTTRKHCGVSL